MPGVIFILAECYWNPTWKRQRRLNRAPLYNRVASCCLHGFANPNLASMETSIGRKKVTILNSQGLKLAGQLQESSLSSSSSFGTTSKNLCILCHGFRSSKELPLLLSIAAALAAVGFSSYRFDFTGNGKSEGEFAYGSYWREAEDLRSVVKYWQFRGWQVVSAIGHSKGGNAVLLYASKYKDVANIVNISGRFDLRRGIGGRLGGKKGLKKLYQEGVLDVFNKAGNFEFRVLKKDLEERLSTDMHSACLEIPETCRVLTVHGLADETVPAEDAQEFAKRIRNHVVHIIHGADHNYKKQQQQLEIATLVVNFLQLHLQRPLRSLL